MGPDPSQNPRERRLDALIAALARRQQGFVTREQLLRLGLGSAAIKYRVRQGRLIRVYAGVYAVGFVPKGPIPSAAAAVLACGQGSVLSHGSAAVVWKMSKSWKRVVEVTAPSVRRRPGIHVHRSGTLTGADITTYEGVPITTAARTVIDIAPGLDDAALVAAIREARIGRFLYERELAEIAERLPRHPGAARVRRLLRGGLSPTRSELEDQFARFVQRFALPTPVMDVRMGRYRVDALFAPEQVIVELDGFDFHRDRDRFESDRGRDATMLARGYVTVRLTSERLKHDAEQAAEQLRTILQARRQLRT